MKARAALCVLVMLALAGCTGRTCPTCAPDPSADEVLDDPGLRSRLQQCFERAEPAPAILLLSGGGSHGAWGAGVLNGWAESGKRPVFRVVTGISTGALQATFAFLGTPADDRLLREAYTTTTERQVFRRRWFPPILFASSLRTTGPLEDLIERYLDDATLVRVADAFRREHRLLFVGTVDLDTGGFRVWDLTRLAARGQYERYRRIVRASAAIPVLFPPVEIDGELHVDGGVRLSVFSHRVMEEVGAAHSRSASPYADRPTAWVVVNGKLVPDRQCARGRILDIAQRSLELLLAEARLGSLFRARQTLEATGQAWDFRVSRVPETQCLDFRIDEFDPEKLRVLYKTGEAWGRAGAWSAGIPDPEVSPLPCGCSP